MDQVLHQISVSPCESPVRYPTSPYADLGISTSSSTWPRNVAIDKAGQAMKDPTLHSHHAVHNKTRSSMWMPHSTLTQVTGTTEVEITADSALKSHQCHKVFAVHFPGLMYHQRHIFFTCDSKIVPFARTHHTPTASQAGTVERFLDFL